jgi:hypothetical protein
METILLPNPTDEYYIAFEGDAKGGHGVCIDDITITRGCTLPTIQASNFIVSNLTGSSTTVGWTKGDGNRVVVLAKAGSPVDAYPIDGRSYFNYDMRIFGMGYQIGKWQLCGI